MIRFCTHKLTIPTSHECPRVRGMHNFVKRSYFILQRRFQFGGPAYFSKKVGCPSYKCEMVLIACSG